MCDVLPRRALACLAALVTVSSCAASPAGAATTRRAAVTAEPVACTAKALPKQAGQGVHVSVTSGPTTATLTGTSGRPYLGFARVRSPQLTLHTPGLADWVTRPRPVAGTPGRGVLVADVSASARQFTLCLVRFDPAVPVAVLGLTSAFNQCCTIDGTYAPAVHPLSPLQDGAGPTHLRVVDERPLLVTGDGRFLAQFADYADSGLPLRIITVRSGRQTDVTRSHPHLLQADAHRWYRLFDRRAFGLGFLACWAADQEMLGHDGLVWTRLDTLNAEHRLTVPNGLGSYWPHGRAYISALRAFLTKTGYVR